ncbi:MAG: SulP family inorganic anion transporter, partial [Gammaproteobacteria bacterium]|nr:SulP family inorganic anion transporter [Gammaproteobacteria bacterium]
AHRVSSKAAMIMYGVIALTVFVDLITAVALGVFVANVLTIERMVRLQSRSMKTIEHRDVSNDLTHDEQTLLQQAKGRILVFALGGPLIFGVAKAISRQHAVLPDHEILILDFSEVPVLGVSSSLALETMILEDLSQKHPVFIVGAEGDVLQRLKTLGLIDALPVEYIVTTRQAALEKATQLLERSHSGDRAGAPPVGASREVAA